MEMALPRQIGRFETADRDLSDPLLAAIVEEAATEIYVFDFETQSLLLANRKARDNTGYGAAEIGAMSIEDVFEADSHDDLKAALRTVEAAAPDPVVYSGRHLRRDGTSYAVEARATLGLSGGRRVVYQFAADRTAANRASERARRVAELQLLCAEIGLAADIPAGVLKWLLSDGGWTLGCFIPMSVSDPELSEAWIGERSAGWDTHDRQAMATFVRSEMFHSFRSVWVDDFRLDDAKSPVSLLMMPLEARGKIVGSFGMIAKGQVRDSELAIGCEETQARLSKVYCLKMSEEELSEARECLEAVDSADTGLWCYNYRTGKFFLSDRAQEILGRSRGQRMPAWTEFGARLHPDDIESTRQSMRRHAAYGAPYRAEYRYRLNGSDYIWLKVRGRGAWGKDGAIVRTAGTLVDITAEKNADLLRRDLMSAMTSDADLDQKLSMVLSKAAAYLEMSDGVVCHFSDGDCDILHATAGGGPWRKGATHPLNDLIWSDIFSAEGVKAYPDLSDSALSAHPARSRFDIAALIGAPIFVKGLRFGTLCFISDSAKDGEFPELKLTTIRSLARWIGEELGRAAKLANLVASDAIKAANLACIGDAVLTVNQTGCIEDANPAASELFGWNTESLRRMYIEQVLPGARAISGPDGLLPVRSRQDVVMRRNGERVAVLLHISDVQLLDRKLSTVVLTDLTLVKQAEAAKRDFVSVVSHELRTPLTSIRGALALVDAQAAGALPPAAANLLNIAKRNSERLVRLVSDILDMEKLEKGKFDVNLRPICLREAIIESVKANTAYADRFAVKFVLSVPEEEVMVIADHDRLLQVMANLLSNAAKFTRAGTSVSISVTLDENRVRVAVTDQGPGIPDSLRPRLFEKFVQGENVNTREREGSGLGLSISRSLMRLMDGDIEYAFEEGMGSVFSISLPRAPADDQAACDESLGRDAPGEGNAVETNKWEMHP